MNNRDILIDDGPPRSLSILEVSRCTLGQKPLMTLGDLLKEKLRRLSEGEHPEGIIIHPRMSGKTFYESNLCNEIVLSNPQERKKTMSLNANERTTLLRLAGQKIDNDLAQYGGDLPADIKAALIEQMTEDKKNAATAAAKNILSIIKAGEAANERDVEEIRSLRNSVRKKKDALDNRALAKAYAMETNNWVPLAVMLGVMSIFDISGEDRELARIPEGWKPKETDEAPAAQ